MGKLRGAEASPASLTSDSSKGGRPASRNARGVAERALRGTVR